MINNKDEQKDKVAPAAPEQGVGEAKDTDGNNITELMTLVRAMAGRLERLEESQTKLEKNIEDDRIKRERKSDPPLTAPMNRSLFTSQLGRGARMHIDQLGGSPHSPAGRSLVRPPAANPYIGTNNLDTAIISELQRLYAAAQARAQAQAPAPPPPPPQPQAPPPAGPGFQNLTWYDHLDPRQKKLAIRPFTGKELYDVLGSGFLDWGMRFERLVTPAQSACDFLWPEDVKVDLLGNYMSGTAERYYNRQVVAWWNQMPTLQFVMEKMLEAFRRSITPAQAMNLFVEPKSSKRSWPEHYMYLLAVLDACGTLSDYMVLDSIVQYAVPSMKLVLMAKVDGTRMDHLQHAEEIAHLAQSWERNFEAKGLKETRRCHKCGVVGHLRASCPNREDGSAPDFTLAVNELDMDNGMAWILDSGSSRHLVNDESWLEDVEMHMDSCVQPNGDPLNIPKKGTLTLRTVKLEDVYYAEKVVHNLISYGTLDKKGYALAERDGQRVLAGKNVGSAIFDVGLQRSVLVVHGRVMKTRESPLDVIMATLEKEASESVEVSVNVQTGSLVEFHKRLGHLNYDAGERLARDPSSGIEPTDHKRVNYLTCAQEEQTKNNRSKKDTGGHSGP
ncbi:hypothetical protein PHMEG_00023404 [Phytophthora megakarya]|uniref:CCHC-type domain-containing protein n=1 Tax=Phytophthora megakarya TaxID=4795 RepID=A0A225VIS9_9STRA|nr:hypothetical protein PHMEG_00023404 [Phytophthora megakarya]